MLQETPVYEVIAAKPKGEEADPPTQASMRASNPDKIRRNPSTDQKTKRREMARSASVEDYDDDAEMAATLAEWPTAGKTIDEIRAVVRDHASRMVDGVFLDAQSANAIVTVYDALSDDNKAKFMALDIAQMGTVAWKLISKSSAKLAAGAVPHVYDTVMEDDKGETSGVLPPRRDISEAPHDKAASAGDGLPRTDWDPNADDDDQAFWDDDFAHDTKTSALALTDEQDLRPLHVRAAQALLRT